MKKLKVASFITLLIPFMTIGAIYLTAKLLPSNWGLLLVELFALVMAFGVFGFISLVMNSIIIKKDGFKFGNFILLVLSLAEFGCGAFYIYQVFF